jgi:orotidine-5'-phosphate decarboxylase
MTLRSTDFESVASTNSAIPACPALVAGNTVQNTIVAHYLPAWYCRSGNIANQETFMADRSLSAALKPHERIILAYDKPTFSMDEDWEILHSLIPHVGMIKVGMQAIASRMLGTSSVALQVIDAVEHQGGSIMYDGKFKDIANTVGEAIKSLAAWEISPMVATIHATMRSKSIVAALEAARGSRLLVTGVTLLTDHDDDDAEDIYNDTPENVVLGCAHRLEKASKETGVRAGMVCAPKELSLVRDFNLIKITPNIRAKDAPPDDQNKNRSMTAAEAIADGADYLVIGRPIMKAKDPVAVAKAIAEQIQSAT